MASFEISSEDIEDKIIILRLELQKAVEECEKLYPNVSEKTMSIVMDG
jgi:hypothetical protein